MYTDLIKGHNGQDDQTWVRTLKTTIRGKSKEVIGLCNYGNLYFIQFINEKTGQKVKVDWIRKTDVNKKYRELDMSKVPVRDNVLDKFRSEFK